ncbi:hypothetical protein XENTR_v10013742 [Xenopus tropicalis]|nr:hypothetical protein XENTR_v10013742 [Xenopus tropicalis]
MGKSHRNCNFFKLLPQNQIFPIIIQKPASKIQNLYSFEAKEEYFRKGKGHLPLTSTQSQQVLAGELSDLDF